MGDNKKRKESLYEPLTPLSKAENEEWEKMIKDFEKARSFLAEVDAKRKLFWIAIERKLDIYNKSLKIENGMIMIEKKESKDCIGTEDS
jgi:hypothetical protein